MYAWQLRTAASKSAGLTCPVSGKKPSTCASARPTVDLPVPMKPVSTTFLPSEDELMLLGGRDRCRLACMSICVHLGERLLGRCA